MADRQLVIAKLYEDIQAIKAEIDAFIRLLDRAADAFDRLQQQVAALEEFIGNLPVNGHGEVVVDGSAPKVKPHGTPVLFELRMRRESNGKYSVTLKDGRPEPVRFTLSPREGALLRALAEDADGNEGVLVAYKAAGHVVLKVTNRKPTERRARQNLNSLLSRLRKTLEAHRVDTEVLHVDRERGLRLALLRQPGLQMEPEDPQPGLAEDPNAALSGEPRESPTAGASDPR